MFASVAAAVGIACYMAMQPPVYYADLCSLEYSDTEQKAAQLSMQVVEAGLERWTAKSLATQREQLDNVEPAYDPSQDKRTVRVTQPQLNAIFASAKTDGEWQNPRVKIRDGRVDFAVEVVTPEVTCVLSAELQPTMTNDGKLRLDFQSVHVGQLPLPLNTILGMLPKSVDVASRDTEFHLTDPTPHVCFNLSGRHKNAPVVKSIECLDGVMKIEFVAPVLKE